MLKKLFASTAVIFALSTIAHSQDFDLGFGGSANGLAYNLGTDTTLPMPNFGQASPSAELPIGPMPVLPSPPVQYVTPMPGDPLTLQGIHQTPDATVTGSITLPPGSPSLRLGVDVPLQSGGSVGTTIVTTPSTPTINLHINNVPVGPSGDTTIDGQIFHSPFDAGGKIQVTTPIPEIFNGN